VRRSRSWPNRTITLRRAACAIPQNRGQPLCVACYDRRRRLDHRLVTPLMAETTTRRCSRARQSNDLDHFALQTLSNRGPPTSSPKRLFPIAAGPTRLGCSPTRILRNRWMLSRCCIHADIMRRGLAVGFICFASTSTVDPWLENSCSRRRTAEIRSPVSLEYQATRFRLVRTQLEPVPFPPRNIVINWSLKIAC